MGVVPSFVYLVESVGVLAWSSLVVVLVDAYLVGTV